MKNKGFTIVEILVVVIILGIIASIALPVYLNINESGRKKASENKIKQIEITAEKWADENNITSPITIPILQLVKSGYMNADEGENDSVIDPYTEEDIKCKQVDIYFENNTVIAKFNEESIEDCEIKMNEEYDENIDLQAYKYINKQEDELVINDIREIFWTNTDVLLTVDLIKDAEYELKENGEIRYSGGGLNEVKTISEETPVCTNVIVDVDKCSNAIVVSGENIITTIYITVETTEGLKTTKVTVKIDKTPPDLRIVVDNSEFINKDREINIRVNDGLVGSGVKELYHNYSNTNIKSESTVKINIPNDGKTIIERDNDKYYFSAVDIAGNISEVQEIEVIRVDKSAPEIEGITDNSEWINKDREVILTASDDEIPEHEHGPNESGIVGIYYNTEERYEDATIIENYSQIRTEFNKTVYKDNDTYYFFAVDYVGNKSEFSEVYVEKVDKIDPVIDFKANDVLFNKYTINTTITDEYSDIAYYEIYFEGILQREKKFPEGSPIETIEIIYEDLEDVTIYTNYIIVEDRAGNVSEVTLEVETPPDMVPFYRTRSYTGWYSSSYCTDPYLCTTTYTYREACTIHRTGDQPPGMWCCWGNCAPIGASADHCRACVTETIAHYSRRNYTAYSVWSTKVCSVSNLCETKMCYAGSTPGLCERHPTEEEKNTHF